MPDIPCPSAPTGWSCAASKPGTWTPSTRTIRCRRPPGSCPARPRATPSPWSSWGDTPTSSSTRRATGSAWPSKPRTRPGCWARWCSSGCRAAGRPRSAGAWPRRRGARGIAHRGRRRRCCKLGFEELGFHRIEARLDALNTASAALCERLGMRLEGRQVDKWHYKGQWATEWSTPSSRMNGVPGANKAINCPGRSESQGPWSGPHLAIKGASSGADRWLRWRCPWWSGGARARGALGVVQVGGRSPWLVVQPGSSSV